MSRQEGLGLTQKIWGGTIRNEKFPAKTTPFRTATRGKELASLKQFALCDENGGFGREFPQC